MDPIDFLSLAEKLKDVKKEAYLRTAISRSYYALFSLVCAFFRNNHFYVPKDASAHDMIYKCLHHSGLVDFVEIASNLKDLRNDRNIADYDLFTQIENNGVQLIFAKARYAFNSFIKLTATNKQKDDLKQKIIAYKQKINS